MKDVLAPGPALDPGAKKVPVGQGPQVVPLGTVLQVLRGSYFNRTLGANGAVGPLPPHRFRFHKVDLPTGLLPESFDTTTSDAAGISFVVDNDVLRASATSDLWLLSFVPLPSPGMADDPLAPQTGGAEDGGAMWIHMKKNGWVPPPPPLGVAVKPPGIGPAPFQPGLEKRALYRVPRWNSYFKAQTGGNSPRKTGDHLGAFGMDGLVTTKEIRAAFGTLSNPWEVQIDYLWFACYVQFHHHRTWSDAKRSVAVPPGLVLRAHSEPRLFLPPDVMDGDGVAGGGTSLGDDGTVYVVVSRTAEQCVDLHLSFEAPPGRELAIDYTKPPAPAEQDHRLTAMDPGKSAGDPVHRYPLPNQWHTLGWEGRLGNARSPWAELRPPPAGTATLTAADSRVDSPVVFHLDDMVLTDEADNPLPDPPSGTRITLFDHALSYREPDAGGNRPQLYKEKISSSYLPGERTFGSAGDGYAQTTRLLHMEGRFFDVREDRLTGPLGSTMFLGARKAWENQHPRAVHPDGNPFIKLPAEHADASIAQGYAHLRLIDVPFYDHALTDDAGSPLPVKLVHVMAYFPCRVTPPSQSDDAVFYKALIDVEDKWNQGHPTHPQGKDYVLVDSGAPAGQGSVVGRFRFFLAPRATPTDAADRTLIRLQRGAASMASTFSLTANRPGSINAANDSITFGDSATDVDGTTHSRLAFWHEWGHLLGIPDEYVTPQEGMTTVDPTHIHGGDWRLPRFSQQYGARWDGWRPYLADWYAQMRTNYFPRLRYYWPLIEVLNAMSSRSAVMPGARYALEHRGASPGPLRYELPQAPSVSGAKHDAHPWEPFLQERMGRSHLRLFRLGDDEGSARAMFFETKPSPLIPRASRFSAVLAIQTYYWFNFTGFPADPAPYTDGNKYELMRNFYKEFFDKPTHASIMKVSIEANAASGVSGLPFQRVALLFLPHFRLGPLHENGEGKDANGPHVDGIHASIVVDIQGSTVVNPVNDLLAANVPSAPAPIRIPAANAGAASTFGRALIRFTLGLPFRTGPGGTLLNGPLTASDLQPVADRLSILLGDPPPSVSGQPTRKTKDFSNL
ncbi:MAG: hypothetical protein U0441_27740 [Polyangiaceae bacterium]